MTTKELKELIKDLPDNVEIKINSIQVSENELKSCEISEAHYDINHGFLITPTIISLCEKNEFEAEQAENYSKHQRALSNLSITDIVKASDYINELATFIPTNNEVLDYLEDIQKPLLEVIRKLQTKKECPRCGCTLYLSDLPQYDYVCPECDENFDEFEVI